MTDWSATDLDLLTFAKKIERLRLDMLLSDKIDNIPPDGNAVSYLLLALSTLEQARIYTEIAVRAQQKENDK